MYNIYIYTHNIDIISYYMILPKSHGDSHGDSP